MNHDLIRALIVGLVCLSIGLLLGARVGLLAQAHHYCGMGGF